MLEGKAVIEDTDMPVKMQARALASACQALDLYDVFDYVSIATHIKKEFDKITQHQSLSHRVSHQVLSSVPSSQPNPSQQPQSAAALVRLSSRSSPTWHQQSHHRDHRPYRRLTTVHCDSTFKWVRPERVGPHDIELHLRHHLVAQGGNSFTTS
ncbi:hypothetical protein F0562_012467 [Nyssa sinensis]|uniref:Uncharacterized protein n=1 Tax=Nyssa sinensis TaxID=561372 RepID=A0A5J4ZV75_9ASTE|nr:hypothetical protein F0562_012467 [Nyssa sinensis]